VPEVVASRAVAAAPERVWAALTDWPAQGRWIPATRVAVEVGRGDRVGDRVVARTGVGRVGFDDPMEITGWQPPRSCRVRHLGRVVRGTGAFEVLPRPGGCTVVWAEFLVAPGGWFGAAALLALAPAGRWVVRLALRRVAGRLPADEPPPRRRGAE
jgi:hypothetical protein